MRKISHLACFLFATLLLSGYACSGAPRVRTADFRTLTDAPWTGTLTYLDYQTKKKVSIPSSLIVSQVPGSSTSWVFEYQYPDEPEANTSETIVITEDGKLIDGETVIERKKIGKDAVRIVTQKSGTDDGKSALFRFTYLLSPESLSIKKEVQYDGTAELLERNEYRWKRSASGSAL